MSRDDDKRWRELFLGYEELDADQRREVDAYLARNPDARAQLEKLQELERRAVEPMGAIGLDAGDMESLDSEAHAGERRSREALLDRLGVAGHAAQHRIHRRAFSLRRSPRVWLPAAAAAAALFIFLGPWNDARVPELGELQVIRLADGRQTRSVTDGGQLRSGDAFVLSFELDHAASVVVYHVDPLGQVSLIVPGSASEHPPRFDAGVVRIPGSEDPEQWVLGGDPGREGFVVALTGHPLSAFAELDAALQEQLAPASNRAERLDLLQSFLGERMDSVAVTEFNHRP